MPVTAATTCQTCGCTVEPSDPNAEYSRQATVVHEGTDIAATYCSNRCINDDAQRLADEASASILASRLTRVGTAALAAEYDAIYVLPDPTAEQDDTASAIIETLDDGGIDLMTFYRAVEAQPELTMLQWCINNGLCDGPPEHADYPHEPGRLYDCYACEHGACTCAEGDAPCVSLYCVNPDRDTL